MKWVLKDKDGYYLYNLGLHSHMTCENKSGARVFEGTEEWIKGYVECLEFFTQHKFKYESK